MYDRRIKGKELTFGVSGKLYESNVLFYDHETESLWSQLREEAVTGPLTGTRLTALPARTTTWKTWREQYPDTLVLSIETGFQRPYDRPPYEAYENSPHPLFPVQHADPRLAAKAKLLGVSIAGHHKAYPLKMLQQRPAPLEDRVGERKVKVVYDREADSAHVVDAASEEVLPSVVAYWFAWATFHPDASLYGAAPAVPEGSH